MFKKESPTIPMYYEGYRFGVNWIALVFFDNQVMTDREYLIVAIKVNLDEYKYDCRVKISIKSQNQSFKKLMTLASNLA